MSLNAHSGINKSLLGTHAFLSPSNPAWVNYDEDKLDRIYFASSEARRGSEMHDLAQKLINMRVKLPDNSMTLNLYVNDAIGYNMTPEQLLFYSENCYGHADAVGYRASTLRIFDLKTGKIEASMTQLRIYAALFFLEYSKIAKPFDTKVDLRIYQNDAVKQEFPDPDEIIHIMEKIRFFDKRINYLRAEETS